MVTIYDIAREANVSPATVSRVLNRQGNVSYLGLAPPAWTAFEENLGSIYRLDTEIYGEDGKLNKPFIIWECVGFSWGELRDPAFAPNDVDAYARYVERPTSWGEPNGIGFAGTIGLAAALNPNLGNRYGQELYGKRIMEFIRYNIDEVQGFAPWFHNYSLDVAAIWNQPLLVGLRGDNRINIRNVFAGRSYQQELFLVNSQNKEFSGLEVRFTLAAADGKVVPLGSAQVAELGSWQRKNLPVTIAVPQQLEPGSYQLRLQAFDGGREVSRNYYDIFVQTEEIVTRPLVTKKKIAMIPANGEAGASLAGILTSLGVSYTTIEDLSTLGNYEVLIIPPASMPYQLFESSANIQTLTNWLRAGGSVLQLEQNYIGVSPTDQNLIPAENTFVDLVIPEHPVFKGLTQRNFDTWDNPDHGYAISYACSPFTPNALAVRGPFLGEKGVSNAVSEGTVGNGRIFSSQLQATKLWNQDSAASTYLRNVLEYMLVENRPYAKVRAWEATRQTLRVVPELMVYIDLKPYANRSFTDEVDGDHLGGWTDQGINDFRMMPLGEQEFLGVPFHIIDPATNNDKSCIVLGGSNRPYFPTKVEGIAVNEYLGRLFFLHTMAWGKGKDAGEYRIIYEDGSVERNILKDGLNITDWWIPSDMAGARLAFVEENPMKHKVGLWLMVWENPHPDLKITSIDFESYEVSVPVLVAVSGEKLTSRPFVIDDFESPKTWHRLSDGQGAVPTISTVSKASAPENVWQGNGALKVVMPPKDALGTPVIFCGFPKDEVASGNYNYLTFWLKADDNGQIRVVLPKDDWSSTLAAELVLKAGEWQKIRLNLNEDMGLKHANWDLDQLRGEFFIYNMNTVSTTTFYLDDIKFE